jgi:hypothetical protein
MNFVDSPQIRDSRPIKDDAINDGSQLSTLVEEETCDVITDLVNQAEDHVTLGYEAGKFANHRS